MFARVLRIKPNSRTSFRDADRIAATDSVLAGDMALGLAGLQACKGYLILKSLQGVMVEPRGGRTTRIRAESSQIEGSSRIALAFLRAERRLT